MEESKKGKEVNSPSSSSSSNPLSSMAQLARGVLGWPSKSEEPKDDDRADSSSCSYYSMSSSELPSFTDDLPNTTTPADSDMKPDSDVPSSSTSEPENLTGTSPSDIKHGSSVPSPSANQEQPVTRTEGSNSDIENTQAKDSVQGKNIQDPVEEKNTNTVEPQVSAQEKKNDQEIQENPANIPKPGALSIPADEEPKQTDTGTCSKTNEEQKTSADPTNTTAGTSSSTNQEQKTSTNIDEEEIQAFEQSNTNAKIQVPIIFQSFTLIQSLQHETDIIQAMALGYNGVLLTGSDTPIVREWHKGQAVSHFESSRGPVLNIALLYFEHPATENRRKFTFTNAFLAHGDSKVSLCKSRPPPEDGFRPSEVVTNFCDCFNNLFDLWIMPRENEIKCLCFSDKLQFLYCGLRNGNVNMGSISVSSYRHKDTIRGHRGAINALAAGERVIFSGSSDGVINMWRRQLYRTQCDQEIIEVRHLLLRTFYIVNGTVPAAVSSIQFCALINSKTRLLYVGSSDGNVRCWRFDEENVPVSYVPEVMSSDGGGVTCLALCSGPFVFSGSTDKNIRVWRRDDAGAKHTLALLLEGHKDSITCITVEDDWEVSNAQEPHQWILYSACLHRILRIWRVCDHLQSSAARATVLPKVPHQKYDADDVVQEEDFE